MSRITVLPAVDDGAILVCGERCFALLRHPSRLELLLASPFKERENSAWVVSGFCFDKAALNVNLRSAEVMLVIPIHNSETFSQGRQCQFFSVVKGPISVKQHVVQD